MKIGVVGKGGVGKTTLAALLAETYVGRGQRVLAVDTDSNPNLGVSLGLSLEQAEAMPSIPRPLATGSGGAATPAELLAEYGRETPAGAMLLSAMRVDQAGAGCTCGSHAVVRSLLGTVVEEEADVTIVDMEAGLEHLSRSGGTLAYADVLVVVMEPNRKSVVTAARTVALAEELGIPHSYGVGNKARLPVDGEYFRDLCEDLDVPLAGVVPHDLDVIDADRAGGALAPGRARAVRAEMQRIAEFLDRVPR